MTGLGRRPDQRANSGTTASTRSVVRLLTVLTAVFATAIAAGVAASVPAALVVVVLAAGAIAWASTCALRSAVLEGSARRRLVFVAVAVAAWAAPLGILPLQWVALLELIAAVAFVSLGRWTGTVLCAALAALLWVTSSLKGAGSPGYYVIGVLLFLFAVWLPVALVRSRRRRDRARNAILAVVERQTRSHGALRIASRLASVVETADALSPSQLGACVRDIHAFVRSSAAGGGEEDAAVQARGPWASRVRVLLLVLAGVPTCALPTYFILIGLRVPGPETPWFVAAAVSAVLIALWTASVLPGTLRPARVGAVLLLGVASIVTVIVLGELWLVVLVTFVAAVLAVAPRAVGATVLGLFAAFFMLVPFVLAMGDGIGFAAALAEVALTLPVVALSAVISLVPRLVASADGADELERILIDTRSRGAARLLAAESHDLLGQTLAAAALNADLAGADARSDRMLTARMLIERALTEARSLAAALPRLDLAEELVTTTACLRSTGAKVKVSAEPVEGASDALAWVLRESTANILRHSMARQVLIDLHQEKGVLTMTIENDMPFASTDEPGVGLVQMRDRLEASGGSVTVDREADLFRVRATARTFEPEPDRLANA